MSRSCRDSPLVQSPYTRSRAQCLQCCRLLTSPAYTCTRYIAISHTLELSTHLREFSQFKNLPCLNGRLAFVKALLGKFNKEKWP